MAKYSFEFKSQVVQAYLNNEGSYPYIPKKYGVPAWSNIKKGVNDFRIAGPDALRPKRKGRRSNVSKPKEIKHANNEFKNTDSEYLKQLEDENLKLRIENAYLKELRRLRLEGTPQNKKRESSTVSEDHSN
ncbi:transposase [Tissierella sp.]|uniref:transposase n=1 Tax=Tissierella sp. TaxID=41274 RepID=UPI0028B24262|nr:transposase [Tissierella sp.]